MSCITISKQWSTPYVSAGVFLYTFHLWRKRQAHPKEPVLENKCQRENALERWENDLEKQHRKSVHSKKSSSQYLLFIPARRVEIDKTYCELPSVCGLLLSFSTLLTCSTGPPPPGDNACRINYGGCSSLCLAIPGGRVCACADDQTLDKNNVTCSRE